MRCNSVRLLLVAMLATQHTDFESFANALGALPNQPPVPMACEPSPSPIDVDTKAIVQQVVDVLLKHSPSPAVHLEVLGRRWLALARNESVTNLTSTLSPAKVPAMKKRDKRAREVLDLVRPHASDARLPPGDDRAPDEPSEHPSLGRRHQSPAALRQPGGEARRGRPQAAHVVD